MVCSVNTADSEEIAALDYTVDAFRTADRRTRSRVTGTTASFQGQSWGLSLSVKRLLAVYLQRRWGGRGAEGEGLSNPPGSEPPLTDRAESRAFRPKTS